LPVNTGGPPGSVRHLAGIPSLGPFLAGSVWAVLPGAAGRKVRIEEPAPPSRGETDVLAALPEPVQ